MSEPLDPELAEAARVVIERHGGSAAYYARSHADELEDKGDEAGAECWRQVARVIEEIQRDEPRPQEWVN